MPIVSTEVINSYPFDSVPTDKLAMKPSHSSTATESTSSDNMPAFAGSSMPQRSATNAKSGTSPLDSPSADNKSMVHTRTNFGKTRGYVPPITPSSPGRVPDTPVVPPSPRRSGSRNRFEREHDGPDDEAHFRTNVRSVRPKQPAGSYYSDGGVRQSGVRLHRRQLSGDPVAVSQGRLQQDRLRPEAYISETDDSSLGHPHVNVSGNKGNIIRASRSSPQGQEARHPSPEEEEEPFDAVQARHPSPVENIQAAPIRSPRAVKEHVPDNSSSPNRLSAEELGEMRRRRRRKKQKQFTMPTPEVQAPVKSVTSTKTSDLTDESAEPVPSFDQGAEEMKGVMESEMEYHSKDIGPPPLDSPSYETFGRETKDASLSPQKDMPKSILRSKRTSKAGPGNDDDDSLFDFDGNEEAKTSSVRKSSLRNGNASSNRKGRRPRRKSDEDAENDDDESLIQYGEHGKMSSNLQERTQQAWTFRSQRSFPKSQADAPSPKKEAAGVQFGNTDTIHHFNDNETVLTTGTNHSLNSLYTKSPESEAEDLIKDLFLIGSGEHNNPGRRKFKYQPAYKRQLRADDRSMDDTTLGMTDVSLNTLDNTAAGGTAYSEVTPYSEMTPYSEATTNTGVTDGLSLETYSLKTDVIKACESMDAKGIENSVVDPLAFVWDYVESGMQALGLTATPPPTKEKKKQPIEEETMPVPVSPVPVSPVPVAPPMTKEALLEEEWNRKGLQESAAAAEESADIHEIESVDPAHSADQYPADEAKDDGKGSFGGVMDYLFGESSKPAQQETDNKKTLPPSSTESVTTTGTPLEEDPRLVELALHAVRSKHEIFDMIFDERFPVDIEKDIKFNVVKTKLPLGLLFHENDGGCWITKVFPDGNAAKSGGVEVGDQLAAINGDSAIKLRVDQICTLITEAPNPDDIQLTFLRYTGELHPFTSDRGQVQEDTEIRATEPTTEEPLTRNPSSRSLNPLAKLRPPSPNPNKSMKSNNDIQKSFKGGEGKTRKGLGKWFGKGKKKSQESA